MIPAVNSYQYITSRFVLKSTTNGWWTTDCPRCGKKGKFAFHFAWSRGKCWSCEWDASIADLVMAEEDLTFVEAKGLIMEADGSGVDPSMFILPQKQETSDVSLPLGYVPLLDGKKKTLGRRASNYLASRGFDLDELDMMGVGYVAAHAPEGEDDYYGRIILPIQQGGRLRYYIGRDFIGGFPKYMNPSKEKFGVGKDQVMFNGEAVNRFKTVYVTEGIFNAITMGRKSVATMGWTWSHEQTGTLVNGDCDLVVILADPGFYGRSMRNALKLIDHKRVKVVNFDSYGHDEDVNTLGRDAVMKLVKQTPDLTYSAAIDAMIQ